MTNTLHDMEVPCREGCNGIATVVRKFRRDEELPPVLAECALGCAAIILSDEQVADAIEFYKIEVKPDDAGQAEAVADLRDRLTKNTDGEHVRYYSAPRKQRVRTA